MKLKKPEKTDMDLNMTSMLDIVFQLIIFFILVTNFAAADLPPLEPPDPVHSKARKIEGAQPRIVNLVPVTRKEPDPKSGKIRDVSTGRASHVVAFDMNFVVPGYTPKLPAGEKTYPLQRLIDMLVAERERNDEAGIGTEVDLRVDRSLPYDQVQPIMRAITAARITRVNLVALVSTNPT